MASKTDTYTFLIFFSLGLWVIYFSTSENFKWNKMKWGLYRALFQKHTIFDISSVLQIE